MSARKRAREEAARSSWRHVVRRVHTLKNATKSLTVLSVITSLVSLCRVRESSMRPRAASRGSVSTTKEAASLSI
jgi:hypothetical protein